MTLKIVLAGSVAAWLVACILLYRLASQANWLAGSSVASTLFLLGATVAASFLVSGTVLLAPLGLAVFVLCVVHLRHAWRSRAASQPKPPFALQYSSPSPAAQNDAASLPPI